MSYERGELSVCVTCPESEDEYETYDKYPHHSSRDEKPIKPPVAWLPHSCDEWVIGGPGNIRALINDLEAALAEMEER